MESKKYRRQNPRLQEVAWVFLRLGTIGFGGRQLIVRGIFLPAFLFVALSGPLIPRLRHPTTVGAILDGVNVASLALMGVVTWHLGRAALVDRQSTVLALASAILLIRFRLNSAWLVLAGGLIGREVA